MPLGDPLLTETNKIPKWVDGKRLPTWAYDWAFKRLLEADAHHLELEAFRKVEKHFQDESDVLDKASFQELLTAPETSCEPPLITINRTAGPAVLWQLSALIGLTYFSIVVPVIGCYLAECPKNSIEMVDLNEIWLWILFFAPFVGLVQLCELRSLMCTLVPRLQYIRKFGKTQEDKDFDLLVLPLSSLSNCCRSFTLWYLVHAVATTGNLLDNMTNSIFAARVWASQDCDSGRTVQQLWHNTLRASSVFKLFPNYNFAELTVLLYVWQLILIPLYAMYNCVPRPMFCGGGVVSRDTGEIKQDWPRYAIKKAQEPPEEYLTFADKRPYGEVVTKDVTDHGQALNVLEECNCMQNLVSQDIKVRKAKLNELALDNRLPSRKPKQDALGELAVDALGRAIARFVIKGFFRNCFQLNLQVSMIGLQKYMYNTAPEQDVSSVDLFNAITVFLTISAMFVDMLDVQFYLRFVSAVEKEASGCFRPEHKKRIRLRKAGIYCWVPLWLLLSILAVTKLVMVFVCDEGEWNATWRFWNLKSGCMPKP